MNNISLHMSIFLSLGHKFVSIFCTISWIFFLLPLNIYILWAFFSIKKWKIFFGLQFIDVEFNMVSKNLCTLFVMDLTYKKIYKWLFSRKNIKKWMQRIIWFFVNDLQSKAFWNVLFYFLLLKYLREICGNFLKHELMNTKLSFWMLSLMWMPLSGRRSR